MMDTARCLFRGGWWFTMGCALIVTVAAAPRTAIIVTAGETAADWQAVITAGVQAERPATELVERGELARVWAERERAALTAKPEATMAVPAVATVERYLHFRLVGDGRWIVELVDAESGRALGAAAADAESPEQAVRLVKAAAGLLDTPAPVEKARATKVAVVEAVEAAGDAELFGVAVRLRAALADSGLVVLDRALTQELAVERNDAKRGFRAGGAEADFLGADYLVELSEDEIRLMRTVDGVVVAVRPRRADDEVDGLQQWLFPLMAGRTDKPEPYLPAVEIEALMPFYRGVALYDAGRFEDATGEFSRAYQLNGRFREAFEWEARSYEALGMMPLAQAVRRYVEMGLLENISAAGARISSGTGVAFLGITGWDGPGGALSRSVSAQAASALARRKELELRIPEHLDELRREYDWMSGVDGRGGHRWEQAPEFFCQTAVSGILSRTAGKIIIDWRWRDTLTGRIIDAQKLPLGEDPADWPMAISRFLQRWPDTSRRSGGKVVSEPHAAGRRVTESVEELAATLSSTSGNEANVARLKLAALEPGHPLVVGRVFVKGGDKGEADLSGFVEYAMREWLIARLPVGDESSRLLELACLQEHREPSGEGRLYAGRAIDGLAGLGTFIEEGSNDPAGLIARYQWLFEQQAKLPPAELAEACAKLHADVNREGADLPEVQKFLNLIESLQRLARVAGGDTEVEAWGNYYDKEPASRRVKIGWNESGRLKLVFVRPEFSTWHLTALDPSIRAFEARATLALNGRGQIPGHFDERWFGMFPRSLALCAYIVERFSTSSRHEELPVAHPLDWPAAEALRSACVTYAADTLEHHMRRVKTHEELKRLDFVALHFFVALNTHDLFEAVPDEEYEAIRARILAPYLEAKARFNHTPIRNTRLIYWTEMSRTLAREDRKDHLRWPGIWVKDRKRLLAIAESLERQLMQPVEHGQGEDAAFNPTRWWDLLRRWEFDAGLTAPELAEFYRRRTPDVLRWFADRQPTAVELPKLYEQALVLLYGRGDPEAEQLFQRILAIPDGTYARTFQDEYQANAAYRLAQLHRLAGRLPEALAMARRGLELDRSGPHLYIQARETNIWNANSLGGHLLRLLRELRHDPARAQLPDRVGVVSVATPNGDNPQLHVFYRTPPEAETKARRRVLVLAPVHNQDALDYLRAESAWARFADEHGLVLVVPQFYVSDRIFRTDHRFTHVRYAQIWSGDALLRALDQIDRTLPIEKGRLLVHGVASGSGFACHLAAWRPELVAAVSVNNGNWGMPRFLVAGLQPMSAQLNVRYFLTGAEEDRMHRAYDYSVDFVTRLRGAGVAVEWRVWPGGVHTPSLEMEDASRAFLEKQLSP